MSPPEFAQQLLAAARRSPTWVHGDFSREGREQFATYTNKGVADWEVTWQEALEYGAEFHDRIAAIDDGRVDDEGNPVATTMTGSGSRVVAVLVVPFCEYRRERVRTPYAEGWSEWDQVEQKSMIFMSTIPRGGKPGRGMNGARTRLEGPAGGHAAWRGHCYRHFDAPRVPINERYATGIHAEDNAINMFLDTADVIQAREAEAKAEDERDLSVDWLGSGFMVVYGIRRDPHGEPAQVLPCGPYLEDENNSKVPCCRWVLDRMGIEWRFGIAEGYPPPPEPQLPPLPPGPSGDGDGNGGGWKGGDHTYSNLSSRPWSEIGRLGAPAGGYYQAARDYQAARHYQAALRKWRAREAQTRNKRIIPRRSDMTSASTLRDSTVSIVKYLQGMQMKPPTRSVAALSVNPGSTKMNPTQLAVNPRAAGAAQPPQGAPAVKGRAPAKKPAAYPPVAGTARPLQGGPAGRGQSPAAYTATTRATPGRAPPPTGVAKPTTKPLQNPGPGGGTRTPTSQHVNRASLAAAAAAAAAATADRKGHSPNANAHPQHADPQQAHCQQVRPQPVQSRPVQFRPVHAQNAQTSIQTPAPKARTNIPSTPLPPTAQKPAIIAVR